MHLANCFLESTVCELQEALIFGLCVNIETERFRIAELRTLVGPSGKDEHRLLEKKSGHILKIHDISLGSGIGRGKDLMSSNFAV